jgi:hypothetical protein
MNVHDILSMLANRRPEPAENSESKPQKHGLITKRYKARLGFKILYDVKSALQFFEQMDEAPHSGDLNAMNQLAWNYPAWNHFQIMPKYATMPSYENHTPQA